MKNTKLYIYIIGALLMLVSLPVAFMANDDYSFWWGLLPLLMGTFIVLYNKYNKVV
jgi:hypothetical protein